MAGGTRELTIRSRYGVVRDLLPIYGLYQLAVNLAVIAPIAWLCASYGHVPPMLIFFALIGWLYQYSSRPSTMIVSQEEADWLEVQLDTQKFFAKSETDDRWRIDGKQWWQRWPHQFIEFVPGPDGVTIIAPRESLDSMRGVLEYVAERGEILFTNDGEPFAFEEPVSEPLAWYMQVPAVLLIAACVIVGIREAFDGVEAWGLSGSALARGRFETIFLHMFAHGSGMHFMMNMSVLWAIGGPLTARLGRPPLNWLRFLALFLCSGLAGAAAYLLLHPAGVVPMVGASGAIYGLIGLLIRAPEGEALLSIRSKHIRRAAMNLIQQNIFLFAMLALMAWSSGSAGGLAWEAHLGGFLFGLFVGPKFLPRTRPVEPGVEIAAEAVSPQPR